jgi:hypothetical protein
MPRRDPKDCLARIDAFIERQFASRHDLDLPAVVQLTLESCQFELDGANQLIHHDFVERRVWFFQKRAASFDTRQLLIFPDLAYMPARIHYRDQNGHSRSIPILATHEPQWHSFCSDYKRKHQERVNRANARLDRLTMQFNSQWDLFGHELSIGELIGRASGTATAETN